MESNALFIHKYEPKYLDEFEMDAELRDLLKTFISIDVIKILFVSKPCNGKTSYIKAMINEYYGDPKDNIMFINKNIDQMLYDVNKDTSVKKYDNEMVKKLIQNNMRGEI